MTRSIPYTISRCLALCALLAGVAVANDKEPETTPQQKVGVEERLGTTIPLDLMFTDEQGSPVKLRDLIDRPTILTLVYYKCPGICSPLLTELTKIIDKMDLVPGTDYRIVTISFNHRDDWELAHDKRDNYLSAMGRHVDPSAWRFLTGDSATIRTLTDTVGFYFIPQGNDFMHSGTLILLSPKGKVTRYLAGVKYLPFDVKMAVLEAAEGRVGPTISKILSMCYSYDPEGRTYVLNIVRIVGFSVLGIVVAVVLAFTVKPRRKKE